MSKVFVIGDIHGAYLALKQVLERSNFNYKEDTLIQLGDIVDGNRPQWIDCMHELNNISNLILLRGNHDQWFVDYLNTGVANRAWISQGGAVTLEVYLAGLQSNIITEDEVRSFFAKQHYYYIDDQNRAFMHAGFDGPDIQSTDSMDLIWDRDMWYMAINGYHKKACEEYKEIYIGHTSTVNYGESNPMTKFNIINMDTGAGGFGKLSMMNIDTKEIFQSDLLGDLYPDIKYAR